jgi:hypothetical protein
VLTGGGAAPEALDAFTYTDTFRQRQYPWLLALIVLNVPLLLAVIVNGRWSATTRRLDIGLRLATCAVMAWTVLDGPVVLAPASDEFVKFAFVFIIALTLTNIGRELYRSVTPAPDRQVHA